MLDFFACFFLHLTLWTDTNVDQNFQRDLGAIGQYEFQGTSVWTNPLVPCFQALKVRQKFPPRLALVHGWLFPIFLKTEDNIIYVASGMTIR